MAQQVFTGRYQIVRHLARGGMAEVYLARDLLLDRPVALKVLFPEFSTDPSFVERFRREARAAANLNHPNIVSVYDWGEEGGTYFIVMEYIEGPTLRDVIRGEGPLFPNRAAEIGAEIAAALEFAHRRGVIHRDVKPGNVLISGMVKVTDFGIARAGDPKESLTQTGAVMGTASYFSPEQAQGLAIDNRSDVYSLGIVLYEMAAGRPPFTGDSPLAIAYQHVRETPVPPSRHNPDVPPELDNVVMKAMAKDRANRYPSANDLRNDLLRFTHGQPVAAEPIVAADDATRAMTATGPSGPADSTRVMGGVAEPPVVVEEEEPPRKRTGAYFVVLLVLLGLLAILLVVFARQLGLGGTPEVVVPSVVGETEPDAIRILNDAGLKSRTVPVNDDNTENINRVIDQDPPRDVEVKKGATVTISVSQGPTPVQVPDVRNRKEDTAREILTAAGFTVEVTERPDDEVPAETVIDQLPVPGNNAPKGSKVTIVVSSGREQVAVPNVAGRDQSEAANILGQAGFTTAVETESSDTVPTGRVIRTDPAASTPTPKGSTVTLLVSSGPPPTTAPPVVTTLPVTRPTSPTTTSIFDD
ncbi:MAG TPA: Stk1 family PASTA domain-containing Ser/Thr kinase [Acidimicrobiales bacterium]|nr:Stk1 family PASTA domain-containing Ser/Thr kinase [Acidimicrobiales bacterium]